jgi:2'-5' RNA ligase
LQGTGLFTNWVGLNVDFKYVKPVLDLVNTTAAYGNGTLISRGEAHVTVILPTEYDQILQPAGVTIDEINRLASQKNRLQKSRFELECLGRVQVVTKSDGVFQQSLQLILKNYKDLTRFRQDVFKLYVKKGGNPSLFNPENFFPHITLGYRHRDIHVEDGIFKGKNACIHKIVAK